jgi:hypothetical protein
VWLLLLALRAIAPKGSDEGTQELAMGRPVRDGEHDVLERAGVVVVEVLTEVACRSVWVVVEGAAAPSAQDQGGVAVGSGDLEQAPDAGIE